MKILVTGGAGFIGSHIVDRLIEGGNTVVIVDNLVTGKKENINPKAEFIKLSVTDKKLEKIFKNEQFEAVFHLAAQLDIRKSVDDPVYDASINILGAINMMENCRKYQVPKIIFSSTGGAIYGEAKEVPTTEKYPAYPISPYGIAKLTTEHYLYYYKMIHNIDYVCLRYANVYGPRQNSEGEAGVVAIFSSKVIKHEQPVIFGSGKQTRDYVFVLDVIEANIKALEYEGSGIFNIGTGKESDLRDILRIISTEAVGNTVDPEYAPAKPGEQMRSALDCSLAKKHLGWAPEYGLNDGIQQTVEWIKEKILK